MYSAAAELPDAVVQELGVKRRELCEAWQWFPSLLTWESPVPVAQHAVPMVSQVLGEPAGVWTSP